MQFRENLKHIFIAFLISFFGIFGVVRMLGDTFFLPVTHFFVYREGNPYLDLLYKYEFTPSKDIVIIKIDNESINHLQAQSNLKMMTISKDVYSEIVTKLMSVGAKGIAFDIVFQNKDEGEEDFARVLENSKKSVIARLAYPGECIQDINGDITTCSGLPRSIYSEVPQGLIDLSIKRDRKYASRTTSSGVVHTLALELFLRSHPGSVSPYPDDREILLTYFGPPESYPAISLVEFLSLDKISLVHNFAGKYVFIGESGTLIHDAFVSPVNGKLLDGVESHAHFLDGIIQQRYLRDWNFGEISVFLSFVILMLVTVSVALLLPKYLGLTFAIILSVFTVLIARFLYFRYGIVLDIAPFLLAGSIFTFPITFIYRFFIVDREKRLITRAFSRYVDPRVVEKIGANAHEIHLGGEAKHLTILFSDIAGFTTLSEKLSPSDLFYLMSSYLSRMTTILTNQGGTLDKYIGDAVMGFYGAPIDMPDQALHACQTALDMRRALPVFNTELKSRGLSEIDFRIGIATGDVVVGNIGSYDRFNYTVLGDTVNLASRLEATSKEYGTHILVSESTYLEARDHFIFRRLDRIAVKGKTEGIMIYELLREKSHPESQPKQGESGSTVDIPRDPQEDIITQYEYALDRYMEGKYLEAGRLFEAIASQDAPAKVMMQRCLDVLEGRVKIEGGVYVMTHK